MSTKDLKAIEVLSEVLVGRHTVTEAASLLAVSERQMYRLLARYQQEGGSGLAHKARGRESNRSYNPGIRKYGVDLVQAHYSDFGPTLAAEVLAEKHGIRLGCETLRRWMMAEGMWLSRKQRKRFHQPRLRRERCGELVQIDGSDHRWFEDRGEPYTLLVFIDDATSRLMQLQFVLSESTESYFEALRGYLVGTALLSLSIPTSTRYSASTGRLTSLPTPQDIVPWQESPFVAEQTYQAGPRSVVVLWAPLAMACLRLHEQSVRTGTVCDQKSCNCSCQSGMAAYTFCQFASGSQKPALSCV